MKKSISFIGLFLICLLIIFITGCPTAPAEKDDDDSNTEAILDSIYISQEPFKTNYKYNDILNLIGLEVKARYDDKTEKIITDWTSNPKNGTKLTTSGTVNVVITYQSKTAAFRINVSEKPVVKADQYFWGTWVRMDNGKEYVIDENSMFLVNDSGQSNSIISSSASELTVSNLGTFKKETLSVMKNGTIPYFRKGGSNLSYTMQLVGFEENIQLNRAAGSLTSIKSKSKKFSSYNQETTPEEDGTFTLNAPIAGDEQIISVDTENGLVIVTGIKIENDGANLGTIPLSVNGQYSLKVTGTIDESEKDNGYIYGNNYKEYPLTLTITNISEVTSAPSTCTIIPKDPRVIVRSTDGSDINGGVLISTLKKGFTKTIPLVVECGSITEGFIDTGLIVNVKNAETERNWQDFVPLRFYGGLVPITIAGESVENNTNAALNGFVIYPDGNSQFFSVPQRGNKIIYVPSFKYDKQFILAFSGATVQGTLSESTEMLYTVAICSSNKKDIDMTGSAFSPSVRFGEDGNKNETEETAFEVTEDFQAYLADGEIDYFKFGIKPQEVIYPDYAKVCSISYINEFGDSPSKTNVSYNSELTSNELPTLILDNYDFDGWYIGNFKVTEGYKIQSNITLTAKWKGKKYKIDYELNGGTNNSDNPDFYSLDDTEIVLKASNRDGYDFKGWYYKEDFSGEEVTKIETSSTVDIVLFAKWKEVYSTFDGFIFVEGGTVVGRDEYNQNRNQGVDYIGAFPVGRTVTLSSFYISDHEVTQGEYETYCCYTSHTPYSGYGIDNSCYYGSGVDYPAYFVSWYDAIVFCNLKSMAEGLTSCYSLSNETDPKKWPGIKSSNGKYSCSYSNTNSNSIWNSITCNMTTNGYRLPTEAEWEYAARGGQKTYGTDEFAYYFAGATTIYYSNSRNSDLDSVGWYHFNICNNGVSGDSYHHKIPGYGTHVIKQKLPNALGLYDMSGNVSEWCWDWFGTISSSETVTDPYGASSGSIRVHRGGYWNSHACNCSVSFRHGVSPYMCVQDCGFRLVRSEIIESD